MELVQSLSDSELAYLCIGGFRDKGSESIIGNAAMSVAGAAGETTHRLKEKGIEALVMADGPAGLRLNRQYGIDELGMYPIGEGISEEMAEFVDDIARSVLGIKRNPEKERVGKIFDQYCTAIPVGTSVAQSWNINLCVQLGDLVGKEMERFGINLWLAPALNIQRVPLCGRNFEYYSEDPLLSGKMALGITLGVQKHQGCGVTIKHYVANNQETNRFCSNSIVSERTLRDMYLKGFRIVVQEANPIALMTSYNLLNGEHTSHRRDLIMGILREEWGFKGLVMSDWITPGVDFSGKKYPQATAPGCIKAGNDLMMPGGELDHVNLLESLNNESAEYTLVRANLEACAMNVIETIWKLHSI